MTNEQLYLAIDIPMLFNAVMIVLFNAVKIGILIAYMNTRFAGIDKRFDDMRDLWRAELHRVEEVLDAG
jgi:hypothetical protein